MIGRPSRHSSAICIGRSISSAPEASRTTPATRTTRRKRGLQNAIDRGGVAVADYVRRYLYKPPSDGYRKLEDADSLDLACEALVADETKPYAYLFTNGDRAAARSRLAPHIEAIRARKTAVTSRID